MKKTLLLGTALVVGVAGFAQSTAKKAVNPKYLQKTSLIAKNKIVAEPQPTTAKGIKVNTAKNGHQSTSAACGIIAVTTSWNCFGVGGGSTTSTQNCLSYNQDLNSLLWVQRGSKAWTLNTTSGHIQGTVINATTLVKDSIMIYHDATTNHARYPSGVFLNPTGNTDYHKAFAVGAGQVIGTGTNWLGTAYCPKPLWSVSAVGHTAPAGDSLFAPTTSTATPNGLFGACGAGNLSGAPVNDMCVVPSGTTLAVMSIGSIGNYAITATDQIPTRAFVIAKGILNAAGNAVTYSADTIVPPVRKGTLGYAIGEPRMAFGPDGMHGYIVFVAIANTTYSTTIDSAMTPMVYATTDGGVTWTQKLAGYDWMCHHPEVEKNVGELTGMKRYYTFNENIHSADVTVDANNMLHFVTCVSENKFVTGSIDSVSVYAPTYDYDYVNYHPIIWDFMTDGTTWKTMMVDSIMSANCGSATTDTTSTHSAMGGASILGVSSHITVSRSKDGSKVFYAWADSDPGITGVPYNINPDVLMKGFDVASGKLTATKNVTNLGSCFYPFAADLSYNDGTNWVVPAMYATGHVVTATSPQTTYDASSQADYYYTNCGTFSPSADFTIAATITNGVPTATCAPNPYSAIQQHNNAFESAISNYPNPFNNTTTIAVTLTENKNVDVKVYNAIGTLVFSKKVNGNVGENNVTFDGSSLSSGVYYYTVTAGNQQATKKMIIQK
ncbi:MAG: T9SS type A sorting domain-containing protein [Bacteroidia bacterium]